MPEHHFTTALVLSGGSARALAHLGVLQELEAMNFRPDLVVGTSMGAVIGGLYACYGSAERVEERLRALFESELFRKTASVPSEDYAELGSDGYFNRFMWLFRKGVYYTQSMVRPALVSPEVYSEIMSVLMPDVAIEKLEIPFAAVAMDLLTGEEIVLTKGPLRGAVAASAAIPGFLPSVDINGRVLVDGGWADNVPVAPAIAMGAHFVLAVDATLDVQGMPAAPASALEIVFRCNELTRILLTRHRSVAADVKLAPRIGPLFWANYRDVDRCVEAGRQAVRENAGLIRRKLGLRRLATLKGLRHPARRPGWNHPFIVY